MGPVSPKTSLDPSLGLIPALLWWCVLMVGFDPARADPATPVVMTREVVVTGTRTEKSWEESPVRVEVVSREEIEKTHARNLKEALEDVPALSLKPIHGKTGFEAWLQGFDADRVLVLWNGEPLTPSTGSAVDLTQIATADIERIEIVKGATSALYGSSAMGGVINVITRRPERPFAYWVSLDGGSYGEKDRGGDPIAARTLSAGWSLAADAASLQLHASLREGNGYALDPDSFRTEGAAGSKRNLDLRLSWRPSAETEFYLAPRLYREAVSNNVLDIAPGTGEIRRKKRERARRTHVTAGFVRDSRRGGRLHGWWMVDRWRNLTQQDALATPEVDQERLARMDWTRAELQWDRPWGDWQVVTAGLVLGSATLNQYQDRLGQSRTVEVDDKERRFAEVYLQHDLFLGERWELVPGLRLQEDSDFGFYAAPKFSLRFTPSWPAEGASQLRLALGRGYRVPNLKERFYVFDHSQLGYMVLGNRGLQPERSDSVQLGIEWRRPGGFRLDLNLFHHRIRDLIETRLDAARSARLGLDVFTYQNYSRARIQGLESEVRQAFGPLRMRLGYTWLESEDLESGKTLRGRPRHQLKWAMDWRLRPRGGEVSLRGIYQSAEFYDADNTMRSPSWSTWDIKLSHPLGRRLRWYAGIDNVTDEHRDPAVASDNRPVAGRFVYLGLRIDG